MTKIQYLLLFIILFSQAILWGSYYYVLRNKKMSIFWGNIPKSQWNSFLIYALIAYILNLLFVLYFVFKKDIKEEYVYYIIYLIIIYYGLQLLFLPFVELLPKIYTVILLFICVVPILLMAYLAYLQSNKVDNILEKTYLLTTGILPLLHVFFNDAIAYGLYL